MHTGRYRISTIFADCLLEFRETQKLLLARSCSFEEQSSQHCSFCLVVSHPLLVIILLDINLSEFSKYI